MRHFFPQMHHTFGQMCHNAWILWHSTRLGIVAKCNAHRRISVIHIHLSNQHNDDIFVAFFLIPYVSLNFMNICMIFYLFSLVLVVLVFGLRVNFMYIVVQKTSHILAVQWNSLFHSVFIHESFIFHSQFIHIPFEVHVHFLSVLIPFYIHPVFAITLHMAVMIFIEHECRSAFQVQ